MQNLGGKQSALWGNWKIENTGYTIAYPMLVTSDCGFDPMKAQELVFYNANMYFILAVLFCFLPLFLSHNIQNAIYIYIYI